MANNYETDISLVKSLLSGNEKAFRIVFDKYYQGLLYFAISYCNDKYSAENLVQEAFILLWEKKEELNEDYNIQAFLTKVVKLKTWNHLEKQRRRISIEKGIYDDIVRELDLKLYTLDSIETSALYLSEIEQIIKDTLQTLPQQTQEIFRMSRQELISNKEIAEKMGLSEKSIEYHITKTLKVLRTELTDYIKVILILVVSS